MIHPGKASMVADAPDRNSGAWDTAVARAMPALLVTLDASGTVEFCSDSYRDYTGLSLAEARQWLERQVVHPDDVDRALELWEHCLATGDELRIEIRLRRHDGEYRWFLVQGSASRGDDGAIERWITTSVDIHELRMAESLAERRGRALEMVSEASRDFSDLAFDLPGLLSATASRGTEALGGACVVQLLSDDGDWLTLAAVDCRNPRVIKRVRQIFAATPNPAHEGTAALVLAAVEPIFLPHADEALLRSTTSPHLVDLLDEFGVSSVIALALRAEGEVLGTLTCVRERGSKSYTTDDVVLAQELATRAAVAIKHAKTVAALHLSESTYRRLAESTPASVLVTSRDSDARYFNDFFMNYVGVSRDELTEQRWLSVIHPIDLEHLIPAVRAATARGDDFSAECRLRRYDGAYRWHLGRRVRISTADGAPERFVHVAIDIDDRHRAEDRQRLLLEASELAAHPFDSDATLDAIASIVVPRLADGAVTFTLRDGTPTVTAFAGAAVATDPSVRETIQGFLATAEPQSGLGRVLETGESVFYPSFEAIWERLVGDWGDPNADALRRPRSLIIVAIKWRERVFGALALINLDPYRQFTDEDLALAEELAEKTAAAMENARLYAEATDTAVQLWRANQAKDEFLGLVSHELRTPITIIMGNAQVLRQHGAQLDEGTRTAALSDIDSEAARLNRIIGNLLSLARVEREPREAEPVRIGRVVELGVERFRNQHQHRFITYSSDVNGDLAAGSEFAVEHSLRNFLSNADKYSAADAPIDVRIERSRDEIVVSVLDRGAGVPPDEIPRIFEPFYRSVSTASTSGVGVGLAVAKRVIEANKGRVWAEPRPGGGMIMAFALPLVEGDAEPDTGAGSHARAP